MDAFWGHMGVLTSRKRSSAQVNFVVTIEWRPGNCHKRGTDYPEPLGYFRLLCSHRTVTLKVWWFTWMVGLPREKDFSRWTRQKTAFVIVVKTCESAKSSELGTRKCAAPTCSLSMDIRQQVVIRDHWQGVGEDFAINGTPWSRFYMIDHSPCTTWRLRRDNIPD